MNLRNRINRLAPDFFRRHFTWLSATLLGSFIAISLLLMLIYVPGITANRLISFLVTSGTLIISIVTVLGGGITVYRELIRRGWIEEQDTNPTDDEDGLSSPARAFVRSDEEVLSAALDSLDGWFSVSQGGEITLHPKEELKYDRKGMLFVLARFVAFQAGESESPWVTWEELQSKIGFTNASANVFVSKMGNFVERNFDPDDFEAMKRMESDEIAVRLNISESYEAAQYIVGNRTSPN